MSEFHKMLSSRRLSSTDSFMDPQVPPDFGTNGHEPKDPPHEADAGQQDRERVMQWLFESTLGSFDNNEPRAHRRFLIPRGAQVRLADSNAYYVQEWMQANGLVDGSIVNGYRIDLFSSQDFMVIEDTLVLAPFYPPPGLQNPVAPAAPQDVPLAADTDGDKGVW